MDEELIEEFKELFSFDEEKKNSILNKIINNNIIKGDKIEISEDVYLCIAIELLDIKDFPKDIIDNAIKMKNKICNDINK